MKILTTFILATSLLIANAQSKIKAVTWDDLKIQETEKQWSDELNTDIVVAVYTKKQQKLDSIAVTISGNYHILNSFDSKTYMLSKDEIIKTPMQRDEVILLSMTEDPKIYFGRKVKLKGLLILSKDIEDETYYKLINVENLK